VPYAIVLIKTDVGAEKDVLKKLMNVKGLVEAYEVYGMYDIVAKIFADSYDKLRETVMKDIRSIKEIQETTTMIVVESAKK
jgi:DNA-binding Lrp family transcriptional regulator